MERTAEIIHRNRFVIERGCHVRDGILIVLEGRFWYAVDGKHFRAEKNSICVFPKGVLFERKVTEPIRCIYLQFDAFPVPLSPGLLESTDLPRTANTIAHLARAVEEKNEILTEHFLQDILLLCFPPESRHPVRSELVQKCIEHMERNLSGQITLRELSQICAVSSQALIRKFRESTGSTPMQYLSSMRIDQSKLLLRDTDMTASQIARACGFENVYYFSNCFLRLTGMRPSEYRKKMGL